MGTHDSIARNLLKLGAVPFDEFLAAPYEHPRRPPPSLDAIIGTHSAVYDPTFKGQPSASAEESTRKSIAVTAEDDIPGRKRKRGIESIQPKSTGTAREVELEEGELVEEKKLSKGQKKKLKRRAKLEAQSGMAGGS